MQPLTYETIELQDYMSMQKFSLKEKKLLYSLRSSCYQAKMNLKKNWTEKTCSAVWNALTRKLKSIFSSQVGQF